MQINLTSILLVATAVVHLLIGLYVCQRSPDAAQKRAFGLMTVAISLWTLAARGESHEKSLASVEGVNVKC